MDRLVTCFTLIALSVLSCSKEPPFSSLQPSPAAPAPKAVTAAEDRATLVAFYHATGGDNWRRKDNWLSDEPLDKWYGVQTNDQGRVVTLRLSYNRLSGSISPQLANLSNLEHLSLSYNQLSGSIPPQLANLKYLEALSLWRNWLSGCIPDSLREIWLNDLDRLGLSFCQENDSFNIELVFLDEQDFTASQKALFQQAARRWESIITAGLKDINYSDNPYNHWNAELGAWLRVNDTVDDLRVFVKTQKLDGNYLAAGGPLLVRWENGLPIAGGIVIDRNSLQLLEDKGFLLEVFLHELGHTLGFSPWFWDAFDFDVLQNPSHTNPAADTHFSGWQALQAFNNAGGGPYQGAKVPLESGGDDSHWRQSVFGDELMTPNWVWPYTKRLSAITIQVLADIGYQVDVSQADAYQLPPLGSAKLAADPSLPRGNCQIHNGPIYVTDEQGRLVQTIQP